MTNNKRIKHFKSDEERVGAINRIMERAVETANKLHSDEPEMVWTPIQNEHEMSEDLPSESWYRMIMEDYEGYLDDEEVMHNNLIHQRIIATWEDGSPQMYQRLKSKGMLEAMAFVSQQRMWNAMDEYLEAGYPVTDAREQAERDHLMLEPEDDESHED